MGQHTAPLIWVQGVADRALRTAIQVFAGYLSGSGAVLGHIDWTTAGMATLFAAVLSVATSLISAPSFGDAWEYQLLERAVKTFLQSLVGTIGAATLFSQVHWTAALMSSGLSALYSVVTSVLTTKVGTGTAIGNVDVTTPLTPAPSSPVKEPSPLPIVAGTTIDTPFSASSASTVEGVVETHTGPLYGS